MKKTKNNENIKAGMLFRAAEIGAISEEKRTVELSFSSEEPVDRWFGTEILDHAKESVDLAWLKTGRAPFLADHDPEKQIGVVEKAEVSNDRRGKAVVRFGKSEQAQAFFQDVKDNIRGNISVGYRVHKMILEEESDDKRDIYRVTSWTPLEISLVSIPADLSVGIGRNRGEEEQEIEVINNNKIKKKENKMPDLNNDAADSNRKDAANASIQVDLDKERVDIRNKEINRIRTIEALAKKHDVSVEKASEFVNAGKTVDEFRTFILDNKEPTKSVETITSRATLGLTEKEANSFSFVRALNAAVTGDWSKAGFEREVAAAVQKRFKGRAFEGQLQIPSDVIFASRNDIQKRDLNVGSNSAGGYLVDSPLQTGSFIELLRNKMMVKLLGAQVISGLEGDVPFPKQTGGGTAYWVNEGSDITESQQSVGQVVLKPKTVGALTEYTRKMLLQPSVDVEMFVRDDLAKVIALAIDKASLKGSGTNGEPLGILNTTGIGSVTITTHTFTEGKLIDLETEVAIDNADLGSLAYLACAADRGRMKKTDIGTDTGKRIWTNVPGKPGVGEVNGYFAYATNQLAEDEVVFGNWADLLIGEWGVLDVNVNPYAKDTSGGVRITLLQDVDSAVRHAESFARTSV